jgi:hypothetical protein
VVGQYFGFTHVAKTALGQIKDDDELLRRNLVEARAHMVPPKPTTVSQHLHATFLPEH